MFLHPPAPFSEKFFLVVIEKDLNRNSVLQMWHLHLKSVQACVGMWTGVQEEPSNWVVLKLHYTHASFGTWAPSRGH